ncbi:MAG TPA: hypothetical protein VM869_22245, partial [Enhygromyxa sp.]|nr:hypothetical protein [Enhygromyxa sp.]
SSAELPALDWPALEALALDLHGAGASDAVQRLLPRVSGLARLRFELDAWPHEVIEHDLANMSSLIELDLDCRGPGPRSLSLTLPPSLERLRLSGFPEVAVHGECEQLETSIHTLAQLARQLCEGVRRLTILDRAPPTRTTLERCAALEWLSVSAQALELPQLMHDLEVLPHLRTLVVRGLVLSQIPALAQSRPELAIHGVDPGWRDPDRWPLPH